MDFFFNNVVFLLLIMGHQSASSSLILVVLAVCLITTAAIDICTSSNSTICGSGVCAGYVMVKGVCTSSCSDGSFYQNTNVTCSSCSALG